jgi:hypothetical protein
MKVRAFRTSGSEPWLRLVGRTLATWRRESDFFFFKHYGTNHCFEIYAINLASYAWLAWKVCVLIEEPPITVAARFTVWNALVCSNTGIAVRNPTRVMSVLTSVFMLSCVGCGLMTGLSPIQGVLPPVHNIHISILILMDKTSRGGGGTEIITNAWPPLWSSGQSPWLQIQRSGFDSRHLQIFLKVVGLERGPLSLVSTIDELLERKSGGFG